MNFVDLDFGVGTILDYMDATGSAAQTYDNHRGLDIDVPSFRYMDDDFPVFASADGVVEETYSAAFDRNLGGTVATCPNQQWNYVKLRHSNGFATYYGHLKKDSIVVSVGQQVRAGDKLGVVGSSGCSTAPHLHLETVDCNNNVIEPMKEGMFISPPIYTPNAPTTIMDTYLHQPVFTNITQMQDPGPTDPTIVTHSQDFSVGFAVSHVKVNDRIQIKFYDPSGALQNFSYANTFTTAYALSYWWGNFNLISLGTWRIEFYVNGTLQSQRSFTVQ